MGRRLRIVSTASNAARAISSNSTISGQATLDSPDTTARAAVSSVASSAGASSRDLTQSYLITSPVTDEVSLTLARDMESSRRRRGNSSPWRIHLFFYFVFSTAALWCIFFRFDDVQEALQMYLKYTSLPLAAIVYGAEPFLLMLQVLLYTHPSEEEPDDDGIQDDFGESDSEKEDLVMRDRHIDIPSPHDAPTLRMKPSSSTLKGRSASLLANEDEKKDDTEHEDVLLRPLPVHPETENMAIIIPTHQTPIDVIMNTVSSCLKFVHPDQIYVVENGSARTTTSDIRDAMHCANLHNIHVLYNPYPNKVLAIYAGCLAARRANFILIMDDDVILPADMKFGVKHLFPRDGQNGTNKCKAVCYPIQPFHPLSFSNSSHPDEPLLIRWQSIEYQASDYHKLLQSAAGTAAYPHGAISLWDRQTLIACCREHDTVFYADDLKMGWWLQKQGYVLRMLPNSIVSTAAPVAWFWNSSSSRGTTTLFRQRVCSWDMAEHVYHGDAFAMLWLAQFPSCGTAAILRLWHLWACWTLIADWIRIPVTILSVAWNAQAFAIWVVFCALVYTTFWVLWDSIAYRRIPSRRCDKFALLTFQAYRWIMMAFRSAGMLRAFLWYLPSFVPPPTIPELESDDYYFYDNEDHDENEESGEHSLRHPRPVWMNREDPHFGP